MLVLWKSSSATAPSGDDTTQAAAVSPPPTAATAKIQLRARDVSGFLLANITS